MANWGPLPASEHAAHVFVLLLELLLATLPVTVPPAVKACFDTLVRAQQDLADLAESQDPSVRYIKQGSSTYGYVRLYEKLTANCPGPTALFRDPVLRAENLAGGNIFWGQHGPCAPGGRLAHLAGAPFRLLWCNLSSDRHMALINTILTMLQPANLAKLKQGSKELEAFTALRLGTMEHMSDARVRAEIKRHGDAYQAPGVPDDAAYKTVKQWLVGQMTDALVTRGGLDETQRARALAKPAPGESKTALKAAFKSIKTPDGKPLPVISTNHGMDLAKCRELSRTREFKAALASGIASPELLVLRARIAKG